MADEAARLAEALRAGKKRKGLSGAQIAEQIERLTGSRPSLMWVSRRLHGQMPLIVKGRTCAHCGHTPIGVADPWAEAIANVLGVDLTAYLPEALERSRHV